MAYESTRIVDNFKDDMSLFHINQITRKNVEQRTGQWTCVHFGNQLETMPIGLCCIIPL